MSSIRQKEQEISEHQQYLVALTASLEKENEALRKLQEEKDQAVERDDPKEYHKIFEKISQKSFKVDSLTFEISKTEAALTEAKGALKVLKEEMAGRLETFLQTKEAAYIENLEKSLPDILEQFLFLYFACAKTAGKLVMAASTPVETGGSTVVSGKVGKFFENLFFELRTRFLDGSTIPSLKCGAPKSLFGPWLRKSPMTRQILFRSSGTHC